MRGEVAVLRERVDRLGAANGAPRAAAAPAKNGASKRAKPAPAATTARRRPPTKPAPRTKRR
jgi:hypothetical protein